MRRMTSPFPAVILIVLAGLVLGGCGGGPAEVRYVNRANAKEVLTLNRFKNVKTKVIYTFHGVSIGSYTLKAESGTTSGTFNGDGEKIKFKSEDGKSETAKIKSDGSFDYAHGTWEPASGLMEKSLKAVASSKEGAAQ